MCALKRLQKELDEMKENPSEKIQAGPIDEKNMYKWEAMMMGPDDTAYAGGVFFLNIDIPTDYPFKPPRMYFTTRIYHPNISKNGDICLFGFCSCCGGKDWSPALTIAKRIQTL